MTEALFPYVVISLAAARTGLSVAAIEKKIAAGHWIEGYATMMLMAGMRPAFAARQLGHSVEVFLRTYARWLDGAADTDELAKLEIAPELPRKHGAE